MKHAQTFKEWFGVQPAAARIVAALYEAGGAPLTKAQLIAASRQTSTGVGHSLQDLRKQMDAGSIELTRGQGYWLTEVGMADCHGAIADAETRASAASGAGR